MSETTTTITFKGDMNQHVTPFATAWRELFWCARCGALTLKASGTPQ